MKLAKTVSGIGAAAMAAVLLFAFTRGDFSAEGGRLLSMPWGIISLVDLYVGFALLSGWILFRKASRARAVVWILFIQLLGSLTASVYAFLALGSSGGDWRRFWLGKHAA